jgi:hypothetical protein
MCINYEKLAIELESILEYDDRPEDVCEDLIYSYGKYYKNITLYHGAFGKTDKEVMKSYRGFISCTYDLDVAESFARSDDTCTVFEIKIDNVLCLDVNYLIGECYKHCPDDPKCKYIYDSFYNENEMLLYFEDIKDNIQFINN